MATNPKKEKLAALTVEQLKPKAKRLGVKLTNPSGNAKTKSQLITGIIKAEDKKPAAKKPAAKKPAAKRSAVKKGLAPVVGASKRRDAKRQALPPGRRVSKGGKVYYERRGNRADAKQGAAKGQMLGEKYNGWTNYETWLAALWFDNDRSVQRALKFASSAGELQDAAYEYLTYNQEFESGWLADIINNAYLPEVNWEELLEKINEE